MAPLCPSGEVPEAAGGVGVGAGETGAALLFLVHPPAFVVGVETVAFRPVVRAAVLLVSSLVVGCRVRVVHGSRVRVVRGRFLGRRMDVSSMIHTHVDAVVGLPRGPVGLLLGRFNQLTPEMVGMLRN